jgi:hypothetical protein
VRRRSKPPVSEPLDPTFIAVATKIVQRSTVGRRWFFHNRDCVAFFHAPEKDA